MKSEGVRFWLVISSSHVVVEQSSYAPHEGREVRVTKPDKPYFSKQTKLSKLDLVCYYL